MGKKKNADRAKVADMLCTKLREITEDKPLESLAWMAINSGFSEGEFVAAIEPMTNLPSHIKIAAHNAYRNIISRRKHEVQNGA